VIVQTVDAGETYETNVKPVGVIRLTGNHLTTLLSGEERRHTGAQLDLELAGACGREIKR